MKKNPTVLFLVGAFAKLQRERSYFWPRLFRERGALLDDPAQPKEKETLSCKLCLGKYVDVLRRSCKSFYENPTKFYAHIEIIVTYLAVNFFGLWVITRHHEDLLV